MTPTQYLASNVKKKFSDFRRPFPKFLKTTMYMMSKSDVTSSEYLPILSLENTYNAPKPEGFNFPRLQKIDADKMDVLFQMLL